NSLPLELLTGGVQVFVLKIFVDHSRNFVRTTVHDRIELSAGRMPELRVELILEERKFLGCFDRHIDQWSRDDLVVVIDAFDHEIVLRWPLTSYGRAKTHSDSAVAGDARTEQR